MDNKKFNKYKTAAIILEKARKTGLLNVRYRNNSKDVMKAMENCIKVELSKVYKTSCKGITLPPCVSIDNIVAHDRTSIMFTHNNVVKIEAAIHIDNHIVYMCDTAMIADAPQPTQTQTHTNINNANKVLDAMVRSIVVGQPIDDLESVMQKALKHHNLAAVMRPPNADNEYIYDWCLQDTGKFFIPCWMVQTDEQLEPWAEDQYTPTASSLYPNIINDKPVFAPNHVYFLEVCCVGESDDSRHSESTPPTTRESKPAMLYQRTEHYENVKSKHGKSLLNAIKGKHVWDIDNIDLRGKRLAVLEPITRGLIRSFPIVQSKSNVIRIVKTVYCNEKGVHVLTTNQH